MTTSLTKQHIRLNSGFSPRLHDRIRFLCVPRHRAQPLMIKSDYIHEPTLCPRRRHSPVPCFAAWNPLFIVTFYSFSASANALNMAACYPSSFGVDSSPSTSTRQPINIHTTGTLRVVRQRRVQSIVIAARVNAADAEIAKLSPYNRAESTVDDANAFVPGTVCIMQAIQLIAIRLCPSVLRTHQAIQITALRL